MIEQFEHNRWGLLVEAADLERALAAIHQYRLENRRWGWRRPIAWPGAVFDPGGLIWCIWLTLVFWISTVRWPAVRDVAQMHSAAVEAGEWWRLFTAVHMHGDVAHLLANVTTGFLLWGLVMAGYGPAVGLLAAYLCGVLGNVAGLVLYAEPYRGLGASGMVMGALGLLTAHAMVTGRVDATPMRMLVRAALAGVLLFVILGTDPSSDVVAHLGGFVAGVLIGTILSWVSRGRAPGRRLQVASGIILVALMIVTVGLSLFQ